MPYSKRHWLTSPPLGLTLAFSVAAVWLTEEAASVTTVGGLDGGVRAKFCVAHCARPALAGPLTWFDPHTTFVLVGSTLAPA